MSITLKHIYFIPMLLGLVSCGQSNNILQVNLQGQTAFSDPDVVDIVFTFQNISANGHVLDQDGDGTPDAFVYPTACGAAAPAQCGYAANAGTITLGELPGGYQYTVLVRLRDSAGSLLYDGTTTFNNPESNAAISVTVD